MKRVALLAVIALVGVGAFAAPASAQAQAQVRAARPVVVHDMEADVIEGVVLRVPDVPVVSKPPKHAHKSLIQVRKTFAPELLASVSKL